MARHQCRQALQQVEVEARAEHIHQRTVGLTLDFIGRHRTALGAASSSRLARNRPPAVNSSPASASSNQSQVDCRAT